MRIFQSNIVEMSISICVLVIALLTSFQEEVLAQALPPYSGAPVSYISNEDDDLGILLAILLLAGRNRNSGCGCCNCCNSCNGSQNILIPFPIPFPTNNPIVNKGSSSDYDDYEDTPKVKSKKGKDNNIYIDLTEIIED